MLAAHRCGSAHGSSDLLRFSLDRLHHAVSALPAALAIRGGDIVGGHDSRGIEALAALLVHIGSNLVATCIVARRLSSVIGSSLISVARIVGVLGSDFRLSGPAMRRLLSLYLDLLACLLGRAVLDGWRFEILVA